MSGINSPRYLQALSADVTRKLPVPIYTIYDRDIPLAHIRACIIVNPIGPGPAKDHRPPEAKTVAGCESASCALPTKEAGESHIASLAGSAGGEHEIPRTPDEASRRTGEVAL